MTVESVTHIDDLDDTYPASSDDPSEGDDHIRNIKTALTTDFANISGAVTATHTELNILDGVTATTAELNILDGVTATAAELNILDGVTATTAELNYVDGVTSAIQDQLDTIPSFASSAENAAGTVEDKAVDPLGIREAFNATGSAPVYACRAWVNFDGTGTVAIQASGNVSSITDNGTGDYTVNFTTALPDANYAATVGVNAEVAAVRFAYGTAAATTSAYSFKIKDLSGTDQDVPSVSAVFFR
jgi:hypothetical protein